MATTRHWRLEWHWEPRIRRLMDAAREIPTTVQLLVLLKGA
jgi:hypothetical protein